METRAQFGYTAPIGTTDDGRVRRLTVHLPPAYAQRLFDARDTGASDQTMREIIAEGFKEVYGERHRRIDSQHSKSPSSGSWSAMPGRRNEVPNVEKWRVRTAVNLPAGYSLTGV